MCDRLKASVNGSRPPLFYGSVKIHKPDRPPRPILSAIGSATYNLSQYAGNILRPDVEQPRSFVRNTNNLVQKRKEVRIREDEVLVSFDAKSLFTSVRVPDAIDAIKELITADEDFDTNNDISMDTQVELIHISLSVTSFQFRPQHLILN